MKPIPPMMRPRRAKKGTPMTPNGTSAVIERSAYSARPAHAAPVRIDWVDYAKGICIVMVVVMHSVLGVELAAGQIGFMIWSRSQSHSGCRTSS
jgi:hypothetical protein